MTAVDSPFADIGAAGLPYDTNTNGAVTWDVNGSQTGSAGVPPERLHSPGSPDRIRILLLAANPLSTGRLAIEEEARAITQKLRLSRDRDTFDLITCWAVQPADLLQYLNQYRPHVVHFSGHGAQDGGILLSASDGAGQPVGVAALAELFRIMRDDIRVVLLNACYTAAQAQAISEHIDFVIGTRAPITDAAATVFAAAFYSALGFGRTIPQAFDQARAALMVHGLHGHDIPELMVRPSADFHLLYQDRRVDAPVEGVAMNANASPGGQGKPSTSGSLPKTPPAAGSVSGNIISGQGINVAGGSITNTTYNSLPTAKKGISFDTKALLAILIADVVFFFYGMQSYTGKNTSAETWRAFIFLVMVGVTGGMIRRWFRRRT